MIYTSIDIETTGLDIERHMILSIGAIIEDTTKKLPFELIPKLHIAIKHKEILGSLYSMDMNKELVSYIAQYQDASDDIERNRISKDSGMIFLDEEFVVQELYHFFCINGLSDNEQISIFKSKMSPLYLTVAGKNFATFDKRFLERLPRWQQALRIRQRIIDPSILYVNWNDDKELPGLFECKKRAKIDGAVSHNALEDAWDVIKILRSFY